MKKRPLAMIILLIAGILGSHSVQAGGMQIRHHDLNVELRPETHELIARDVMEVLGPFGEGNVLRLRLNPALEIDAILVGDEAILYWEEVLHQRSMEPHVTSRPSVRTIEVRLPDSLVNREKVAVSISYQGTLDDSPRAVPGLRFVRPDQTNGHIGQEGIYLSSETDWYPSLEGSLSTFQVVVTLPQGWVAVTHGKETKTTEAAGLTVAEWEIPEKTEALSLVANRFIVKHQTWNGIDIATYLFEEEAVLAQQYLDATVQFLEVYSELLGPYPFTKFAVVENFFPSGLGMPSFTLLGQSVIRRGYTQPYSLGHEIVHSWIGNSVYNDVSQGNWVEGLTTYLANYYYEERVSGETEALAQRTRMFYEYNLYADSQHDYPLVQFQQKENRVDNAVGYQKSALVFHMLRREVGDAAFFRGIRHIIVNFSQRHADWQDLQKAFEQASDKKLDWFFQQWVQRKGVPGIQLVEFRTPKHEDSHGGYWVRVKIRQVPEAFRMQVLVRFEFHDREPYDALLDVWNRTQTVSVWVPARPVRLTLDPDFHLLRRLQRPHIPPMLNQWTTDESRQVVHAIDLSPESPSPFQAVIDRVQSDPDSVAQVVLPTDLSNSASVLILGGLRENPLAARVLSWCGEKVRVDDTGVSIQQQRFAGEEIAVLVSCTNPHNPDHVGSVFWGYSMSAVQPVARLLFFYGWDSYLVFQEGRVIHRGIFLPQKNPLSIELPAA